MSEQTIRLGLPYIVAGQAQKELSHNEALLLLDALVQATVEQTGLNTPPQNPSPGQSWVVGSAPIGAWIGAAEAIALFTPGGWRFVSPMDGMAFWSRAEGVMAFRASNTWNLGRIPQSGVHIGGNQIVGAQQPAIPAPASGVTIDSEARFAIGQILETLRNHGLISA